MTTYAPSRQSGTPKLLLNSDLILSQNRQDEEVCGLDVDGDAKSKSKNKDATESMHELQTRQREAKPIIHNPKTDPG